MAKRLTDLDPNWWYDEEGRRGMGLTFHCPTCPAEVECWMAVPFENPLDGGPKSAKGSGRDGKAWWQRTGETFADLTLKPSLDVKLPDPSTGGLKPHWHGFITNGEVTEA